jgi:7,8-dihydropterin-6-yl-methyl-4-(beta-D-ribofuranosyl)aminobenzene 5'-phosphate synthase
MTRYLGSLPRRQLLSAVGRGGLGLAGGLLTGLPAARAESLKGAPPEVDRLVVRVLTDSYFHQFEPPGRFEGMTVMRPTRAPSTAAPRTLQGEWGLALHAESQRGGDTRRVQIDFGFTSDVLNNNVELLGVDPGQLDAIVLTHGHYDHFGGMVGYLARHKGRLKRGLPFYLGGEECFCTRETGPAAAPTNFGTLDRKAIADAGLEVVFADTPSVLAGHGFTTGPIPLVSFETPAQPTRMRPGLQPDGMGCAPEKLAPEKRTITIAPDDFAHEQATCYLVKGKGLVVMTSCGHRGIVNSVRQAMKVSGVSKVHAVIGGFHLMPMPDDYVRRSVAELKALNPDFLIPMHCSGNGFFEVAKQELPGRVPLSSTGTAYVFGG